LASDFGIQIRMKSPKLLSFMSVFVACAWMGSEGVLKSADKRPPAGAGEYPPIARSGDGENLALSIRKLERGFDPPRPFLIWALGSSYTAKLGNGDELIGLLKERFGSEREIVYKRMVGNSCPWQYLRGWVRHLAVPDQPDLVLIYTNGKTEDLEKLIREIRTQSTADIVVPSLHWRVRGKDNFGQDENAPDVNVTEARELCRKHGVEFVENRRDWGAYLQANGLKIEDLLADAVHQSEYGASIVNQNIAAHFVKRKDFAYQPDARERRVTGERVGDGRVRVRFTGTRIDLIGTRGPKGGFARVKIDGRPASEATAFRMSYVQPAKSNFQEARSPARDQSPHGVRLVENVVPQSWTIALIDDAGNYSLTGSVTGDDGKGNGAEPFVSRSGQIQILPDEWRRLERNRKGDQWSWTVERAAVSEVRFHAEKEEAVRMTLAAHLVNGEHVVELATEGLCEIEGFDVFEPPLR
jgi:hypothetical protein